ncbi:MAG: hypothetical protein U0183_08640 [Polyangiaceae bacterium]
MPSSSKKRVWVGRISGPDDYECPATGEHALLLVVGDVALGPIEQSLLSERFVRSGCRYVVCFGPTSSTWDDSIDMVSVMDEVEGRPSRFVMTTWHDDEPLEHAVEFFARCTSFEGWSTEEYVVVVLGGAETDLGVVREAVRRGFCEDGRA